MYKDTFRYVVKGTIAELSPFGGVTMRVVIPDHDNIIMRVDYEDFDPTPSPYGVGDTYDIYLETRQVIHGTASMHWVLLQEHYTIRGLRSVEREYSNA